MNRHFKDIASYPLLIGTIYLFLPGIVSACPVCYGAVDSVTNDAINLAIFSLMGITGTVVGSIVAFFLHMRKRAKLLDRGDFVLTAQGDVFFLSGSGTDDDSDVATPEER